MTDVTIGERIVPRNLTAPIGVTIESTENGILTREVDGWHSADAAYHFTYPSQLRDNYGGPVTSYVPFTETLAQHKQRFAVTLLAKAAEAGGGGYREGALDILRRLGLIDPRREVLRVGSWVQRQVNLVMVPAGAVLLSGARNRVEGHTLYVSPRPGQIRHLSGPRRSINMQMMQVVALPADHVCDQWPEAVEDEERAIIEFRVRAWDEGWREKQERGWCGDYERSMSVLDMSETNTASLRSLLQETPDGSPRPGMVCTVELMDAAPVGTVVSDSSYSAAKQENGRWLSTNGSSSDAATHYFHSGLVFSAVPDAVPTFPVFAPGTQVSSQQQQSCAMGAVFAYRDGEAGYLWARAEGGHNGTLGITLGATGVHWSNSNTFVVWDGTSPIHDSPVLDHRELEKMPLGTVIGQQFEDGIPGTAWRKTSPDRWTVINRDGSEQSGSMTTSAFGTSPLRYVHIPVPGITYEARPFVSV